MSAKSRIRTAIDDGLLALPAGNVTIIRPDASFDIGSFSDRDVTVCTTVAGDQKRWEMSGYATTSTIPKSEISVVSIPRSKAFAKSLVAQAAENSALVVVDGTKTDGIDSLFNATRKVLGDLPSVTKAHGRVFWFAGTDALKAWRVGAPERGEHGFFTTAGVFSDGAIDKGSVLLASALPKKLPKKLADLGAGWGYLSHAMLQKDGVETIDLYETEQLSLDCARLNINDPRAKFYWADVTDIQEKSVYDGVVMNPPFHTGRTGDPQLGQTFIQTAARILKPQGTLWMVANRHLPYEATLADLFAKVEELSGNGGFKIFKASRPKR